jgi:hypothetical protein
MLNLSWNYSQWPNRFVISTGAYPDFLPHRASNDHGCGSPQREPHALYQSHCTQQEIRGSVVERSAVFGSLSALQSSGLFLEHPTWSRLILL